MPHVPTVAAGVLTLCAAHVLHAQSDAPAGRADIRFSGELDVQYAVSSVHAEPAGFLLRRARLNAAYVVGPSLDGYLQAELAGGGGAELRDAWVRFTVVRALALSAGQFKRAFDVFELDNGTDLSVIERDGRVDGVDDCAGVGGVCSYSRLTERLGYAGRDVGVRVEGSGGRIGYLATLTNGTMQNVAEENRAKSLSGRLTLALAHRVVIGGDVALHDYVDPVEHTRHAPAWGADVRYGAFRSGLLLQATVTGGDNWRAPDAAGEAAHFLAVQGMAAWYVPISGARFEAVEPLLRLSYGDPDTASPRDGGLLVTPGLMAYVSGKNKIGFNVDVWSPQAGDGEVSLKVQIFLHL